MRTLPDIDHQPAWLHSTAADEMLRALRAQLPWEVHHIRMFGREMPSPRLSCWMGDEGASYRYSGTVFEPHPWHPLLQALRERLTMELRAPFNSVLANLYRDGKDAMGWHRDDEPELGREPVIASISLGATRRFLLKDAQGNSHAFALAHGDLLVMSGASQSRYRHALPRTARPIGARINLTFRQVTARPG